MKFLPLLLFLSACTLHSNRVPVLPGLDAHMHVHSQEVEDDMTFTGERALFAADSIDIRRAVILSQGYHQGLKKEVVEKQNEFVSKEQAKHSDRLAGACAVNPLENWAIDEVKRCQGLNLRVLKLHTLASGMDLKTSDHLRALNGILRLAEELNLTVLLHGHLPVERRGNEAEVLLRELERHPRLRIIIGHLLGREFRLLESFNHPRFLVEISAAPIMIREEDKKDLVETMRRVGMERFIFGSDWPVFHPAETLKALKNLPLTEPEVDAILFKNSEALDDLFQGSKT